MSEVYIQGVGAVSPAGWGVGPLRKVLQKNVPVHIKELSRPGWDSPLRVRRVPTPSSRPVFLSHDRLRRSSPITHYAVAAALEALGHDTALVANRSLRLGIICCVMSGCISNSRRFYDETWRGPSTATPLVFPETFANAPASHLAALLGTTAINYTLVGDAGVFLQGLALAADWLAAETLEACLVIGAEELDWLTADALRLFRRSAVLSEGAGALYLRRTFKSPRTVQLRAITDAYLFSDTSSRRQAVASMRAALPAGTETDLLFDSREDVPRLDQHEAAAWQDWPGQRFGVKKLLGEGLMAGAAWQCVAAVDARKQRLCSSAMVSVVGCNHQAIGAQFS